MRKANVDWARSVLRSTYSKLSHFNLSLSNLQVFHLLAVLFLRFHHGTVFLNVRRS